MREVRQAMEVLRLAIGEVEALAAVTRAWFDSSDWYGVDSVLVFRTGHVLDVLAASASRAVGKFEHFEMAFVDAQPEVEPPTDEDTSPGKAMSAEDAAIVRRIRALCPDRRFDGGSDVELLQLFKHNKQVLHRNDEDVIAAMTRPR